MVVTVWVDCNDRGLPHVWIPDVVPGWYRCTVCPYATRDELEAK